MLRARVADIIEPDDIMEPEAPRPAAAHWCSSDVPHSPADRLAVALGGAYVLLTGHLECAPHLLASAAAAVVAVAAIGGFNQLAGTVVCAALVTSLLREYPAVCVTIGTEALPL